MSTLRRQGAWAVADQVLSSGTNFVPALLLARYLGPSGYGAFSLAFLAWFSALAILRAALMQPYTLAAAWLDETEWREITSRASGVVLVSGVIVGVVFAVVGVTVGSASDLGQALISVAVLAPGLALQEFWRVASFAAQRARTATANDGIWAIGQVVAFVFVLSRENITVAGGVFAWGIGGLVAAGLGMVQLSVRPRFGTESIRWAREWARVGAWFTATSATFTLGTLAVAVTIAANTGSAGVGLFRTVSNLFGPVGLLTIGAESVFLPHLVRAIKRATTTGVGESWRYSLVMAASVAVYGLVILGASHTILTRIFGPAFAPATVLVFPMLIAFTVDAMWSGAELLVKARANGGRLLIAQATSTVARVAAVAVLVRVGGLRGAGWGLVIGSVVACLVFWTQVLLATDPEERLPRRTGSPVVEPAEVG